MLSSTKNVECSELIKRVFKKVVQLAFEYIIPDLSRYDAIWILSDLLLVIKSLQIKWLNNLATFIQKLMLSGNKTKTF